MAWITSLLVDLTKGIGGLAVSLVIRALGLVATVLAALLGGWIAARAASLQDWRPTLDEDRIGAALRRLRGQEAAVAEAEMWSAYLGDVFFNGALVAFLSMLVIGLLVLLFTRRFRVGVLFSALASVLIAAALWRHGQLLTPDGGLVPAGLWWPTVPSPLVAAPGGLGAWHLLARLADAVAVALDTPQADMSIDIDLTA